MDRHVWPEHLYPSPKQHAAMSSAGSGETSTLTELHDHILSSPPLLSRGTTTEVGWQLVNAGAVMEAGTCLMSATTWPVLAPAPECHYKDCEVQGLRSQAACMTSAHMSMCLQIQPPMPAMYPHNIAHRLVGLRSQRHLLSKGRMGNANCICGCYD
jgi:hypothetical protein